MYTPGACRGDGKDWSALTGAIVRVSLGMAFCFARTIAASFFAVSGITYCASSSTAILFARLRALNGLWHQHHRPRAMRRNLLQHGGSDMIK